MKTIKLTRTNLYALAAAIKATTNGVIRRVPSVHVAHLKRCIAAGALVAGPEPRTWVLSDLGRQLAPDAKPSNCALCEDSKLIGFYDRLNPLRPQRMVVGLGGTLPCPLCGDPAATRAAAIAKCEANPGAAAEARCAGY